MSKVEPPVETVTGHSLSLGAAKGNGPWFLVLHLVPWQRERDAAPVLGKLRVEIPVSEEERKRWMSTHSGAAVLKLEVQGIRQVSAHSWSAAGRLPLEKVEGGEQLRAAIAERARPVEVMTPVLGQVRLDRQYNWFEGTTELLGSPCDLSVKRSSEVDDAAADKRVLEQADGIVLRLRERGQEILQAIEGEMRSLYNETWRESGDAVLGSAEFIGRFSPSSAVIYPDGAVNIYFSDGGLFQDHAVEVRISEAGAIREICLAG